jgi:DNA-binding SARP family transcriptional activator
MEFRILGSLVIRAENGPTVPTAPKQQQTLAVLLLQANRFVPTSSLLRELWGDVLPRTSASTLQTYIAQVRRFIASATGRSLGDVMENVLTTEPGGYLLRVDPDGLDLHRFNDAVSAGRSALHSGALESAAEQFRKALGMWRGSALENVQHGPILEIQVRRLEQLWLTTTEQRYELDLKLGRHQEVLGDLTELAEQNPLHENFHALLMRAFHQSGRRAEALSTYHVLRRRLAEELGLDPSQEMAALQQTILTRPGGYAADLSRRTRLESRSA